MKAAVTTGKRREVIVKDVPMPKVRPGTLLLKTKYCSICGTDLEYLDGTLEYRKGGDLHEGGILGHEFSAEVIEIGEGVTGWAVGDRATTGGVRALCGQCYYCLNRMYHMCLGKENARAIYTEVMPGGYGNALGAMAEYFLRPAGNLLKLPDNVSDEEGALVEPLSVGVGGVKASEIEPGSTAVVIGAGKIGLGAMMCAKAAGASPVIIVDIHRSRLDKALEMGADVVLNAKESDVIHEVVRLTEAGPDTVIICARDAQVLNEAIDMVRRGGKVVIVGQVPPTEVNPGYWIVKQLKIEAVLGRTPMITALNLIKNRQVNVKPMISEIVPLDDVQRGFDSIWSGENIGVLLQP
jgi:(R,R)-butanediol dehydrogenase/meso-butanediol dehydrogenase/diacetyl reductase